MATREIADAIAFRGVTTRPSKFVPTIYSTLLNSRVFVRLDRCGLEYPQLPFE